MVDELTINLYVATSKTSNNFYLPKSFVEGLCLMNLVYSINTMAS